MPKVNYVPDNHRKVTKETASSVELRKKNTEEKLEVMSEKKRNEMDFSKIYKDDEIPPDLEPVD